MRYTLQQTLKGTSSCCFTVKSVRYFAVLKGNDSHSNNLLFLGRFAIAVSKTTVPDVNVHVRSNRDIFFLAQ